MRFNADLKKEFIKYASVLIIGSILLTYGIIVYINDKIDQKRSMSYSLVNAHDVEVVNSKNIFGKDVYTPIYFYEVNGVEYSCESNFKSFSDEFNKNNIIYFDSKNPSECKQVGNPMYAMSKYMIAFLIGGLFSLLSIVNIFDILHSLKRYNYLFEYGELIKKVPYYCVNVKGLESNEVYKKYYIFFRHSSGKIVCLPYFGKKQFKNKNGFVDILIDPYNLKTYHADLEINIKDENLKSEVYQLSDKEKEYMKKDNIDYEDLKKGLSSEIFL